MPVAHVADAVLVPATTGDGVVVLLVELPSDGVTMETARTTDRSVVAHLTFDGATGESLGDPVSGDQTLARMVDRALVGLAALQVGVCEEAVRARGRVHVGPHAVRASRSRRSRARSCARPTATSAPRRSG